MTAVRWIRVLAIALSLALPLAFARPQHCGARDDAGVELRLVSQGDPHSLDPIFARNFIDAQFTGLSFDSLVEADSANHLQPDLASIVPTLANGGIVRDGLTYTLHLRRGVRW